MDNRSNKSLISKDNRSNKSLMAMWYLMGQKAPMGDYYPRLVEIQSLVVIDCS